MRQLKRFAVTIAGVVVLLLGGVMMVAPGPGILGIVAGLAILATEYAWARRLLVRAREEAVKVQRAAVASPLRTGATVLLGVVMVGLGVAMVVVDDIAWPVADDLLDAVWSPLAGGVVAVMGVVVVTTTVITVRTARGEPTTHVPEPTATADEQ